MFPLQSPQMLQMLKKSLRKSLPESLKVYGTVFHINQGNPFKLKVLVDKWPDFNTVVVRPQEQDMTDDLDHYTTGEESLALSDVMNWKQHLQIQSSQSSLDEVIQSLAAANLVQVKRTQCILYMMPQTARKLVPFLVDTKNLCPESGGPKAILFKLSSLDIMHAALVNKFWHFGGNERNQRFIERCILAFPSSCLLGPEGTPVSWALMDQTGEIQMAATVPEYWAQGLVSYIIYTETQVQEKLGFPLYNHMEKANKIIQKMSQSLHHVPMPCDWNQWNYASLKLALNRS
uniref:Glycine N-acyltransferase-like protein n=1 Tax=Spermophilus dauricus TaxID=99837 RepID=A0A8C9Q043_SPEDA